MKFATAKEHRAFFGKHGWIEFEGLVSRENLAQANLSLDEFLADRLHRPDRMHPIYPDQAYMQGRDIWRASPFFKKLVLQVRFAEIASDLVEEKTLRLGYDQFLPGCSKGKANPDGGLYEQFLEKKTTLQEVSCIKEILCGLVLALDDADPKTEESVSTEGVVPFPKTAGHVIYLKPDIPIDWSQLVGEPGRRFYLIAYCSPYSHYFLQSGDPHTHALKRIGYVFNDKLRDHLHPIVYR